MADYRIVNGLYSHFGEPVYTELYFAEWYNMQHGSMPYFPLHDAWLNYRFRRVMARIRNGAKRD